MAAVTSGDTMDELLVAYVLPIVLPAVVAVIAGRVMMVVSLSDSSPLLISKTLYIIFCCTYL
jgi:hypothetical protein